MCEKASSSISWSTMTRCLPSPSRMKQARRRELLASQSKRSYWRPRCGFAVNLGGTFRPNPPSWVWCCPDPCALAEANPYRSSTPPSYTRNPTNGHVSRTHTLPADRRLTVTRQRAKWTHLFLLAPLALALSFALSLLVGVSDSLLQLQVWHEVACGDLLVRASWDGVHFTREQTGDKISKAQRRQPRRTIDLR